MKTHIARRHLSRANQMPITLQIFFNGNELTVRFNNPATKRLFTSYNRDFLFHESFFVNSAD